MTWRLGGSKRHVGKQHFQLSAAAGHLVGRHRPQQEQRSHHPSHLVRYVVIDVREVVLSDARHVTVVEAGWEDGIFDTVDAAIQLYPNLLPTGNSYVKCTYIGIPIVL